MSTYEERLKYKKRLETKKRKREQQIRRRLFTIAGTVAFILILGITVHRIEEKRSREVLAEGQINKIYEELPDLKVELLTLNEYSRPGTAMEKVNGIVIHYTANPGTDAMQNRDYFEGLKDSHQTKASSHFIIGLDGSIVQCIPTKEISYASNERNKDTISIECCHETEDGKFNEATYQSLLRLTAWLLGKFELTEEDVIRHFDVTGKKCPLYYVEHEEKWEQFKEDLNRFIRENGTEK